MKELQVGIAAACWLLSPTVTRGQLTASNAVATTRGKKAVLLQEQVQKKGRAAFRTAVSASASMEDSSRKKSLGTTETLSVPYLPSEFDGKQGPADYITVTICGTKP